MNVQIINPCNEKWEDMQPAKQGKHCASCNHTVIDFTSYTDIQILEYFKIAAAGKSSLCGRLPGAYLQQPPTVKKFSYASAAWAWLLSACLLISKPQQSFASKNELASGYVMRANPLDNQTYPKAISIKITNGKGAIIPNARIVLKNSKKEIFSSKNGSAAFTLPAGETAFTVYAEGYLPREIKLTQQAHYQVSLILNQTEEVPMIMGKISPASDRFDKILER